MSVISRLYVFFASRKRWLFGLLGALTVCLLCLALSLRYKEDIFDFLPSDSDYSESMQVFTHLSEASRIVVIFEGDHPDSLCRAIDALADYYPEAVTQVDIDGFLSRLDFVYAHLPYFLSDSDYAVFHRRLAPDSLRASLLQAKALVASPGTSFLLPAVANDPLRLVPLSKGVSGQYAGAQSLFTSYDGYMMTADHRLAFAFVDSPYGSTESARNGDLVRSLASVCKQVQADVPSVSVRMLGAPVIAVGNADCIKRDTLWAILLSLLLIGALLWYAFPVKRDIALIFLSVGFGWLFGMAALAMAFHEVSAIVLGIGAVLLGIAVNYPLHLLVHQRYTLSVAQTLQEVVSPLVIGNITTVGAFLALLPLQASALRQLGLFAAANLVGTIVFCVLFLPHLMRVHTSPVRDICLPAWVHRLPGRHYFAPLLLAVLLAGSAVVMVAYRQRPLFDPDVSHLNYMTARQRADFAFFEGLRADTCGEAYTLSQARSELQRRETLWRDFWRTHDADSVAAAVSAAAQEAGLRPELFAPFCRRISEPFAGGDVDAFSPAEMAALWQWRFDVAALNRRMTTILSDNFDYLGLVCSLIVLVFLCLCFRSLVLGLIAFVPMLFSWLIIVALMHLFGLQFNIVNVILATFIFGQGDDYTIFVVEGLLAQHRTGKRLLPQFSRSILLSALIMLMAIGVLVFARHPAMVSLGAVTFVGMSSVLFVAYTVPPLLFRLACHWRLIR